MKLELLVFLKALLTCVHMFSLETIDFTVLDLHLLFSSIRLVICQNWHKIWMTACPKNLSRIALSMFLNLLGTFLNLLKTFYSLIRTSWPDDERTSTELLFDKNYHGVKICELPEVWEHANYSSLINYFSVLLVKWRVFT